jgi:enoyl-CoA hydratase
MTSIRAEKTEGLLIVTMSRGKANPLNAAMVDELNAAIAQTHAHDVRGLVLSSDRPNFFSAGFDVKEVFQYEREAMTSFFGAFMDLHESLFRLPKPAVAALSGHTVAGGAVLALACDIRVMAQGPFRFALNEVNLGIILPLGIVRMAVDAIGMRHARELFLSGETLMPPRALEIGLVHELAEPEEVLEHAVARAHELAAKPAIAFAAIKRTLFEVGGHAPPGSDREHLRSFVDHWFSPESTQRRQELIDSMV